MSEHKSIVAVATIQLLMPGIKVSLPLVERSLVTRYLALGSITLVSIALVSPCPAPRMKAWKSLYLAWESLYLPQNKGLS